MLFGDPSKAEPYVARIKWLPGNMSRPHFHPNDRHFVVISGTWWLGSGEKYDPNSTVAAGPGTYVYHKAKGIHYDGAKTEEVVIQVWGMGAGSVDRGGSEVEDRSLRASGFGRGAVRSHGRPWQCAVFGDATTTIRQRRHAAGLRNRRLRRRARAFQPPQDRRPRLKTDAAVCLLPAQRSAQKAISRQASPNRRSDPARRA